MITPTESLAHAICTSGYGNDLFVILTAYFDESGTHRGTDFMTMAGYIGEVRKWREFDRRWRKMLDRKGWDHVHAKDLFRAAKTHLAGHRQVAVIDKITRLTDLHLMTGASMTIDRAAYREHYRKPEVQTRRVRFDSEYGLAFRVLAIEFGRMVGRTFPGQDVKIHFILEEGHANAGDAVRIFEELKSVDDELRQVLETITFGAKKRYPGLQVADAMAHLAFKSEMKGMDITDKTDVPIPPDFTIAWFKRRCPQLKCMPTGENFAEWRANLFDEDAKMRSAAAPPDARDP